jgi:glutathione S-transferase
MTISLYYTPASSPCRAVIMTANAAGVKLNLKYLDLFKGEHMSEQFLKVCGVINLVNPSCIFC